MNTRLLFPACAIMVLLVGCGSVTPEPLPEPPPTPSNTPLPTSTLILPTADLPTPVDTPTPKPSVILTEAGFRIVYTGPLEAQAGGTMVVTFQVFDPNDQPAQGIFFATLGDPPSDSRASHANGELDEEGRIGLTLGVNWPPGMTKLYCGFQDQVYEVIEIVINP